MQGYRRAEGDPDQGIPLGLSLRSLRSAERGRKGLLSEPMITVHAKGPVGSKQPLNVTRDDTNRVRANPMYKPPNWDLRREAETR